MLNSRYIGTDMCQRMIDAANSRFFDHRATFTRGTTAKTVSDYTIVSGTYNMHVNAAPEKWVKYIHGSLKQLWKFTRRGLAFNMLGNVTTEKYKGLYYGDPEAFLNFSKKNLSSDSEMTWDLPLPDLTILVRRS